MSQAKKSADESLTFSQLSLPESLTKVLTEIGYERPSPIQAASIPVLQKGRDLIGQAQTGTGKTAAFALPLLAKIDLQNRQPQALILTPTRELAIQVAEALSSYAKYLNGFRVLPVYGGQAISQQFKQLSRGAQVIVGTPGRVMDHMRRGKLNWQQMHTLVLDEADEMLRMGFLEDVEWILEHTPENRQIALFSATMPREIRRVSQKFLNTPEEIKIKSKTQTAATIEQKYISVAHHHKLDALTRLLEVEETDAVIIFVRTKTASLELTEKLNARGYACAAINGDLQQSVREQTIERLKQAKLDILIATDVAARGLDVERISHVINYDISQDAESYVHRIGRTGRAGRKGIAILFVTPREKRMLSVIEKVTGKKIQQVGLPSVQTINDQRVERFKLKITEKIDADDLQPYLEILQAYQYESNISGVEIAAAIASLLHEKSPLLLKDLPAIKANDKSKATHQQNSRKKTREKKPRVKKDFHPQAENLTEFPEVEMERFVISVGRNKGIKPSNIVGAVANEVDIESCYIGQIEIYDEFSSVDLPKGMPKASFAHLKKVRVCGVPMNIVKAKDFNPGESSKTRKPSAKKNYKARKKR